MAVIRDYETLKRICDVLGIDPNGLIELSVDWKIKELLTYSTRYIHELRLCEARRLEEKKRKLQPETFVVEAPQVVTNHVGAEMPVGVFTPVSKSWRENPQL